MTGVTYTIRLPDNLAQAVDKQVNRLHRTHGGGRQRSGRSKINSANVLRDAITHGLVVIEREPAETTVERILSEGVKRGRPNVR